KDRIEIPELEAIRILRSSFIIHSNGAVDSHQPRPDSQRVASGDVSRRRDRTFPTLAVTNCAKNILCASSRSIGRAIERSFDLKRQTIYSASSIRATTADRSPRP